MACTFGQIVFLSRIAESQFDLKRRDREPAQHNRLGKAPEGKKGNGRARLFPSAYSSLQHLSALSAIPAARAQERVARGAWLTTRDGGRSTIEHTAAIAPVFHVFIRRGHDLFAYTDK